MLFNKPRRSGFTLLEVSLVIFIIFLLILALIPAFRGKRAEKRYHILPPPTPPARIGTPMPILDAPPVDPKLPTPSPAATPQPN
ncbi:MAG: prepilin-type N-terminal cleavage/methylation domain-containing protein [Chthoniobacteraceae bacterium]